MTSLPLPASWLAAALARAFVVPRPAGDTEPGAPGPLGIAARAQAVPGGHAEPAWSRELFDPSRDEDPFEWLGFSA